MQKLLALIFTFCITFLYSNTLLPPVELSVPNYTVGQSMFVYEDPDATMTFSDIAVLPSNDFEPLAKPVASHLFTSSAFWYKFDVKNSENRALDRLMVFEPAWLDSVIINIVTQEGKVQRYEGGNIYPYAQRSLDHYLINFEHLFDPGISTVYIQVKTRDPFIVSVSILEKSLFLNEQLIIILLVGLIYGGIIAMLFYNLFLYFGIKERYYAYYVLYLGTYLMANASYNGYTFMSLFSDYPNIQNWSQSINIYFFVLSALLFARSFLNLEKYHLTLYKMTTTVIYVILAIAILSPLAGGYHTHVMLSIVSITFMSAYIFVISLVSWQKGNRSARFFLLGATSGLIGAFFTSLTVMSFIPYSYWTYKASDYGIYVDVVLISLALADRMKITQEKKLIAEQEAKTDVLTGLSNRRYYYKVGTKEYQRLKRNERNVSVVVFDIDNFKNINDSYGHALGDLVLENTSRIIKETIREYDYAFRMGGDEFLLLLPETEVDEAYNLAERIRKEIKGLQVNTDEHILSITASFGISDFNKTDITIESIAKRADTALYQAKRAGKDRVVIL